MLRQQFDAEATFYAERASISSRLPLTRARQRRRPIRDAEQAVMQRARFSMGRCEPSSRRLRQPSASVIRGRLMASPSSPALLGRRHQPRRSKLSCCRASCCRRAFLLSSTGIGFSRA